MEPAFVYDLAFVSRTKSLSRRPEIAVVFSAETYEKFMEHLHLVVEVECDEHVAYLPRGRDRMRPRFLFGEKGYMGYRGCCRIEREHDSVQLYFELRLKHLREIVVTLALLLLMLHGCFKDGNAKKGEKHQLLQLSTYFRLTPHGHGATGWAFPRFGSWLQKQHGEEGEESAAVIREAMMEVWRVMAPRAMRPYADRCGCVFRRDGRFSLTCEGDACDLSIYPEGMIEDLGKHMARIDSHNVESPHEQITLMAGLAAMCGLARKG